MDKPSRQVKPSYLSRWFAGRGQTAYRQTDAAFNVTYNDWIFRTMLLEDETENQYTVVHTVLGKHEVSKSLCDREENRGRKRERERERAKGKVPKCASLYISSISRFHCICA